MPKINRIRIANVSWEKRMILDELYDSYDGADMLLNLANGGGKSVLVQMMLQPILPTRRIHKRKIDDYVSKTSAPTIILIEWKLDSGEHPFYLLTGIAMCSIGQSEEQASRTKYFTFLNYYDEANAYDIRHIPLIVHEDGGVIYTPYEKARELLRQAKGDSFQLRCFMRDESDGYRAALREYGILPEEWELIADINDKEGGVDELFSACKTSDGLMDKWILRTVSEDLSGGSTELRELFLSLMASILEKEDELREKELLEEFGEKADAFVKELSELCEGLDAAEKAAGELSGLYAFLDGLRRETERKKTEIRAQESEQTEKLETIRKEEASENFLRRQEEHRSWELLFEAAKAAWESAKSRREDYKQAREALEASRYAEDGQKARETRKSLGEQLELLRAGREDEDFQSVAYTLFVRYGETAEKDGQALSRLFRGMEEDAQNLRGAEQSEKELTQTLAEARRETGALDERVRAFLSYEDTALRELALGFSRDLAGELPAAEIELGKKELQKRKAAIVSEEEKLARVMEENREREAAQKVEREALGLRREAVGIAVENAQRTLDGFEKARARREEILKCQGLAAGLYDTDACRGALARLREGRQEELDGAQRRYLTAVETLRDCETGNLHTARRFGELLDEAGISYDTGETYLARLPQEEQDAVLCANPMLPYCFLVAKSDLARLPNPDAEETVNRICPVIAFEDVDTAHKTEGRMMELPSGLRLACFYNGRSLRAETKDAYAGLLRQEIERLSAAKSHLQEQIVRLEADLYVLAEEFPYTAESPKQLADALEDARWEYREVKERAAALEKEAELAGEEALRISAALRDNREKAEEAERHDRLFHEFLERDARYTADLRRQRALAGEISEAEGKLGQSRRLYRELSDGLSEKRAEKARLQRERDDFTKRRAALGDPGPASVLEESLPVLEERYGSILSRRNTDEKRLLGRIDEEAEKEDFAQKGLRRFAHLAPSLYENVRFSDEAMEAAVEKERGADADADRAKDGYTQAQVKFGAAGERLADARKALAAAGLSEPLAPEQIFGDYGRRRQALKELLAQLSAERADCDRELFKIQEQSNRIQRYIEPEEIPPAATPRQGSWREVDILSVGKAYKQQEKQNGEGRNRLQDSLRQLRRNYMDRHPVLTQYLKNIPLEETAVTYGDYYFVYERMADQSARLRDTLAVLTADLAHLETDKLNITRHALIQGRNLYDGLRRLSKSSTVNLWPGTPPKQTLRIGVPDALGGGEEERMATYVEQCIATLRTEKAAGSLTEESLRKRVNALFSDRQLLCQTLSTADIPVFLYKVDRVRENSGLRKWEDVLVENSGGELFVSCFVLVSALMSYRRDSVMGKSGVTETTRAFLIDNPFGKTSSKHLLEAMLRIAQKFKTQMICLSDLSQSSITNRFALIYQLSVRQALYSRNSYLRTDEVRRNGEVYRNERLEHTVLYTPPEQLSLFGV